LQQVAQHDPAVADQRRIDLDAAFCAFRLMRSNGPMQA
jgi:hypothetical protein